MSRKKFGTAAAAFAAESLAAVEPLAAPESLVAAGLLVEVLSAELLAGTDCADVTVASVVRASIRPSAADRCRSKGPPSDESACRSAGRGGAARSNASLRDGSRSWRMMQVISFIAVESFRGDRSVGDVLPFVLQRGCPMSGGLCEAPAVDWRFTGAGGAHTGSLRLTLRSVRSCVPIPPVAHLRPAVAPIRRTLRLRDRPTIARPRARVVLGSRRRGEVGRWCLHAVKLGQQIRHVKHGMRKIQNSSLKRPNGVEEMQFVLRPRFILHFEAEVSRSVVD